jgi:hypothetical protein
MPSTVLGGTTRSSCALAAQEHRVAAVLVLARRSEKAKDYMLEAEIPRRRS